jgi:sialate O-acetylesterase
MGHAEQYACLFPAMITQWRKAFQREDAYFGFVQLSSWCADPEGIAEIRDAQMAAFLSLPKVGYATNADHGAGCNIHPPAKKFVGVRLGNSALALVYGQKLAWKSPTYKLATVVPGRLEVRVEFSDVVGDLELRYPANYVAGLNCSTLAPGVCAWAAVLTGNTWTNSTLSVTTDGKALLMSTPRIASGKKPDATRYGYGAIPMLSVYDSQTGLPVLPWGTMPLGPEEHVLVV